MAAMIEDRLATGDRPEDCDFPLHVGHPKCFSYQEWEGSFGEKGLHCDHCGQWAGPEHVVNVPHHNRMRWQHSADASNGVLWEERWR
eukprot:3800241-Lingulodinium_polyedra.AAC.1